MVLVLGMVSAFLCVGLTKITQASLNSSSANKVTLQAQSYAETEGELLRSTAYADLASKGKSNISGTTFSREVIVGAESDYNSSTKQKQCIINVYKDGESLPRYTLKVNRLNKGSTTISSVPQGAILPWYGSTSSIPDGYVLCNGQNGTPDLRNRFIVGAGSSYNLGATGGADTVTLAYGQMPSHAHSRGTMNITGSFINDVSLRTLNSVSVQGAFYGILSGTGQGGGSYPGTRGFYFDASRSWTGVTSYEGSNQAHENRPPYYALFYIMKL